MATTDLEDTMLEVFTATCQLQSNVRVLRVDELDILMRACRLGLGSARWQLTRL